MDAYLIPAVDGVAYGLLLFVVAAGLTLAFGVGDVLNLAHGTLFAFGAYAAAKISDGSWASLALAVLAGTAAAGAGGALLSALLVPISGRYQRHGGHLAQALLTFGVALVAGDLLVAAFGHDELPVVVPSTLDKAVSFAGHSYPGYRLAFLAVAALIAVALSVVVARTRVGSLVRATVDDRDMVAMLGVNPLAVRTGVLAAGGALAGLAGALGAPIIGPGPRTADLVLLLSLVVVVLGGLGSVGGALVAAIAVGEIQTVGVTAAPTLAPFALFGAMAIALAARARGLLPSGRSA